MPRLDIDYSTYQKVKKNSGADFIQTIEAYWDTRRIFVPKGTFAMGSDYPEITFTSGSQFSPMIIGGGPYHSIITGSGTKMFDILNTDFEAAKTWMLIMKNLRFEHTCANATDITLDLVCAQADLEQIICHNQAANALGTAFKCGHGPTRANTGKTVEWRGLHAQKYDVGYHVGLQNLDLYSCLAFDCEEKAYFINDLSGLSYAQLISLTRCRVQNQNYKTTCFPFFLEYCGPDVRIIAPEVESATYTRQCFFMAPSTLILDGAYVDCVAADVGKQVNDDGGAVGVLIAYDNVLQKWWIDTTSTIADNSVMTIAAGTGAGDAAGDNTVATSYQIPIVTPYVKTGNTLTNDKVRLVFDMAYAHYSMFDKNPGLDATPIHQAEHLISPFGTSANPGHPGAPQDFIVTRNCILTSTDSGGADCAILIKDFPGGNTIGGPFSTILVTNPLCRLTAGMAVNWGNYSGAEPAVTAWFLDGS